MDFRKNKKKPGEKSLWQQMGRDIEDNEIEPSSPKHTFSNLRSKLFGDTASEVATEEAKKLKKRMGR
jgi:hypothetical protein